MKILQKMRKHNQNDLCKCSFFDKCMLTEFQVYFLRIIMAELWCSKPLKSKLNHYKLYNLGHDTQDLLASTSTHKEPSTAPGTKPSNAIIIISVVYIDTLFIPLSINMLVIKQIINNYMLYILLVQSSTLNKMDQGIEPF